MTKYIARLNNEIVGKRTSDRTYTHAVVCSRPSVGNWYHGKNSKYEAPHVAAWCGRPDLAQSQLKKFAGFYEVAQIVPVEVATAIATEVATVSADGDRTTRSLRSLSGSFDTRYEGEGY
jgi:hypothetical protein